MLLLAPMDGLTDPLLRHILTSAGGFDYTATEFVRVTSQVLPRHVFLRYSPELDNGGFTAAGTPVFIQILGGNPQLMAENASRISEMGAPGIDINFGCPAKRVNSHDGGSVILKDPCRVFDITKAVRQAVPQETPVTVKIRLGYEDKSRVLENALAAQEAGAHWLTVHARTKVQGYKPPADWEALASIREALNIPLIGNGDIWTLEDYQRCKEITGCEHFMLGRGAVANPFLALEIKMSQKIFEWQKLSHLWHAYFAANEETGYLVARSKQWLKLLSRQDPRAGELFEQVKRITNFEEIKNHILSSFSDAKEAKSESAILPEGPDLINGLSKGENQINNAQAGKVSYSANQSSVSSSTGN